eukprot:TRINITY_DN2506_c0_g1_i3.p1 TRINITY_DN2506_c0_g1~~TRINITY_DN2506_c0_g1_i3.p1  ORF type:complete len:357 (+),score=109.38 TRINITY_DN2506_c0_g1_i3:486-1556(+)
MAGTLAVFEVQLCGDYYGGSDWPPGSPADWSTGALVLGSCGAVLYILAVWSYVRLLLQKPGFVHARFRAHIGDVLEPDVMDFLPKCLPCNTFKPERTHHCRKCGVCIVRYDHHCPWIAQCVGHRNHKLFLNFLTWAALLAVFWVCNAVPVLLHEMGGGSGWESDRPSWYRWTFLAASVVALAATFGVGQLCVRHWEFAATGYTSIEKLREVKALKLQQQGMAEDPQTGQRVDPDLYRYGLGSARENFEEFFADQGKRRGCVSLWLHRLLPFDAPPPHDGSRFSRGAPAAENGEPQMPPDVCGETDQIGDCSEQEQEQFRAGGVGHNGVVQHTPEDAYDARDEDVPQEDAALLGDRN